MPVNITTRTAPPTSGVPGTIDTLFVAAKVTTVPGGVVITKPFKVRSIGDWETAGFVRADAPITYDGLDNFFREGGRQAYVAVFTGATTLATCLALFTEDLGGGQIVAWDSPSTDWPTLAANAAANRRFALLDVSVTDDTVAELTTKAASVPTTLALFGDYCAAFGPWITIPPPAGVIGGGARQAPASSTAAALIARADQLGNPNRAPAGRDFPLQYATGTVETDQISDANAATFRDAGLNIIRQKYGLFVLDGFQTGIDTTPDTPYWQANCSRTRMYLVWAATAVGFQYEYKTIDGRGLLAAALAADLSVVCKNLWDVNGLYGETPPDAYAVEVGTSVNTPATIAQGQLKAVVTVRLSLHARTVTIELVTVPITGSVSS